MTSLCRAKEKDIQIFNSTAVFEMNAKAEEQTFLATKCGGKTHTRSEQTRRPVVVDDLSLFLSCMTSPSAAQ